MIPHGTLGKGKIYQMTDESEAHSNVESTNEIKQNNSNGKVNKPLNNKTKMTEDLKD